MRWTRLAVLAGIPIVAALFSVAMGRDANWDFLNYRWYDPWALLHGRLASDVLVAEHATFYNPLLELPFFLAANHLPGIVAGFLLALVGSITFVPLCLLAEACLPNIPMRFAAAALIGIAGLLGGGVLGQIGVVSWDLPLGTFTLLALWLLCRDRARALDEAPRDVGAVLLLAGGLAGAAAGLKLTAAIYPLGLALALVVASRGRLKPRLGRALLFSIGAGVGLLLCGGYWMWRLYEAFGNPVFPYFNGPFHSPFAATGSNRDATFLPHGWRDTLLFPFLFTANSLRVAEYHFRDVHIALAWVLGLGAGVAALVFRRRGERVPVSLAIPFLFVFAAASFIAWEGLFAIYRYILPLEMLSSLLIVLAILNLPLKGRVGLMLAAIVLLAAGCLIQTGWNRRGWDPDYVSVHFPAVPGNAALFLTGNAPMGFAVTALPDSVPALRIGSYLAPGNRFGDELHERIAALRGPMLALFHPGDEAASVADLSHYGLAMGESGCEWVTSNVSDPLKLCPGDPQMKRLSNHPLTQRLVPLIPWRFVKFGIVGTGGYLTDVVMLKAFVYSGMDKYWGQIPAFLVATVFTWMANRFWTFSDRRGGVHIGKEWLRYLTVTTAGFCINYAGYSMALTLGGIWERHLFLPVAVGSIVGLLFNFPMSRFVFRKTAPGLQEGPTSFSGP